MPVQIARYVGSVLSGDLGTDLRSRRPVTEVLAAHAPYTVELILAALLIAWITVIGYSYKAAQANPADALRYE